jgi:hypothetical protein
VFANPPIVALEVNRHGFAFSFFCRFSATTSVERAARSSIGRVILVYFVGSYFLPVLFAFGVVQRLGRRFHESDAMVILVPYVAYWLCFLLEAHHYFNFPWALFATGCVVAACMPFRLLSWLGPWHWAGAATLLGALAAYIAYSETVPQTLVLPV